MSKFHSVADAFYEAALVPELWPQACEALTAEVNATTAIIFAIDHVGEYRFVSTPNIRDHMINFANHPTRHENLRPKRALERMPFTFGRETDILSPEELERDVVYKEIIQPAGMQWEAGCIFQEPSGHLIMFVLQRKKGMDHYSDAELAHLNTIKPDLARSVFLASRIAFSEAQSIASTLSILGLPAFVLGSGMAVIAANSDADMLSPRVKTGAFNHIFLENRAATDLLSEAFCRLQTGAESGVQSIPLPSNEGLPPLILHLLPIRRSAHDIFHKGLAILVVTAVGTIGSPDMRVLSGLFDLTPAEVRVAREIALSHSVETIAGKLGTSVETVRPHVKRIMSKTGTTRQPELMYLLLGLSPPIRSNDI